MFSTDLQVYVDGVEVDLDWQVGQVGQPGQEENRFSNLWISKVIVFFLK